VNDDYRPWTEVGARPEVEVMVVDLPAGIRGLHARSGDGHRAILINRSLPAVERIAALAHELAHDDHGGGHPTGLPAMLRPVVARDENRVDQAAAARLLPRDRLARWVDGEVAAGRTVTARSVADGLDVARWVADLQLRLLWVDRTAGRDQSPGMERVA